MLRISTLLLLLLSTALTANRPTPAFAQQAASERAAEPAYAPAYLKDRPADFMQRARDALQVAVDQPSPALEGSVNPTRAILNYGIAALALQQNASRANEYIAELDLVITDPKKGLRVRHLSLAHAIRLYMLYSDKSPYMGGRLT